MGISEEQQTDHNVTPNGSTSVLSEDQSNSINQEPEVPNKPESDSELAEHENAEEWDEKDGWMDLLSNGDILKKTLNQVSENACRPTREDICWVTVHTYRQDDGSEIKSEFYENVRVIPGDYDLIPGLDLVLPMMRLHEQAQVLIKPRFGYGSKGKQPDVPGDCALDCKIELLFIANLEELEDQEYNEHDENDENQEQNALQPQNGLPCNDQVKSNQLLYEIAKDKKERGNFWFGREEYSSAGIAYNRAARMLEKLIPKLTYDSQLADDAQKLQVTIYNNLAMTYIRNNSSNKAVESAEKALDLDANNVKALYRLALALKLKGEIALALSAVQKATGLQTGNKDITNLLNELQVKRGQELNNEKQLYRRMLRPTSSESGQEADANKQEDKDEPDHHRPKPKSGNKGADKGKHKEQTLCKWMGWLCGQDEHMIYLMAGSCFVAALFSMLAYYFIFVN